MNDFKKSVSGMAGNSGAFGMLSSRSRQFLADDPARHTWAAQPLQLDQKLIHDREKDNFSPIVMAASIPAHLTSLNNQ